VTLLLALPIVIPMTAGALSLVFWRSPQAQRGLAVLGTLLMLVACTVLLIRVADENVVVLAAGDWAAPYGIILAADRLGAILTFMTGVTGFAVAIYSLPTVGRGLESAGYYPLMHLLLAGVAGAFLTGDIFNLYVWFEVLLLASFALLAMGGEKAQMAGAIKYVVLNLVSSALFLTAIGLLYGLAGTLNMADLSVKLAAVEAPDRVMVIATLFMVAFGIKAAAFPLFFWLPASYHTAPVAVSALFAGLLTKVGIYALYRTMTLLFTQDPDFIGEVLHWVAVGTLLAGVLGAVVQTEFRRMLAFAHIGQIGYLFLGLAIASSISLTGGVFYLVHHIIVMSNLFFIAGVVYGITGTHRIDRGGGLWSTHTLLGVLFLLSALSLAGIPPLSGFWAKFIVIKAAVLDEAWWLVGSALLAGLLTLYAVMRVWLEVFWKPAPAEASADHVAVPVPIMLVISVLSAATLLLGLVAQPLWQFADGAASQLLDSRGYVQAVLGGSVR